MNKDFTSRFMPNVYFKVHGDISKLYHVIDIDYLKMGFDYFYISHCGTKLFPVKEYQKQGLKEVSIFEAIPEIIPDGMRYNKELDKLVSDIVNVEFEKVLSVSENGDITEREIKINLSEDEKNMLDSLRNSGKSFLDIIKIIKNSDTFTPSYYGAKCKCGEKLDAYAICDKYANEHKPSAWHHAVKKLIRAGDGHKPLLKDIDEVIDSLKRWKEQLNAK